MQVQGDNGLFKDGVEDAAVQGRRRRDMDGMQMDADTYTDGSGDERSLALTRGGR